MSPNTLVGVRSAVAVRRSVDEQSQTSFLFGLDAFCSLLDVNEPVNSVVYRSASPTLLLNSRHYQLARHVELAEPAWPVLSSTWSQGLAAVLTLSSEANRYALRRSVDLNHPLLIRVWHEAIGVAWFAEMLARALGLPHPFVTWQAGILLSAAAISEQMRLLCESPAQAGTLSLGTTAMRQIEKMVIQADMMQSLSLAQAQRSGAAVGPWPCVGLAIQWCRSVRAIGWADRFFERLETLPTSPLFAKILSRQLPRLWPQYMALAKATWIAGGEAARARIETGEQPRLRTHWNCDAR